ncbi:MAG: phosphatidate cytidylyltransferase [Polaribacter sp.]
MSGLSKRGISGIIYVTIFIATILFSEYAYIALISIFGILCIWEFSKMLHFKNFISYIIFGLSIFLFLKRPKSYAIIVILLLTLASSIYLIYQLYAKKEITYRDDRSKSGMITRYLIFPFSFLVLLPFYDQAYYPYLILYILILVWINDSFAFLVGKNFGKRKLFESVSPKKTIEGFVGGFIFSLIAGYVISNYATIFTPLNWMIIASMVSVLGTIGDLVESKFKRQATIKDSGNIMPGHGGILDRLDSLLFVAPFVYLYINFII